MQLDLYRDSDLEKVLIVKHKADINELTAIPTGFLLGLTQPDRFDSESPTRLTSVLDMDKVLEAVQTRGFYAARHVPTGTLVEKLS